MNRFMLKRSVRLFVIAVLLSFVFGFWPPSLYGISSVTLPELLKKEDEWKIESRPKAICQCGPGIGLVNDQGNIQWFRPSLRKRESSSSGFRAIECWEGDDEQLVALKGSALAYISFRGGIREKVFPFNVPFEGEEPERIYIVEDIDDGEHIEGSPSDEGEDKSNLEKKKLLIASRSRLALVDEYGSVVRPMESFENDVLDIDIAGGIIVTTVKAIHCYDKNMTLIRKIPLDDMLDTSFENIKGISVEIERNNNLALAGVVCKNGKSALYALSLENGEHLWNLPLEGTLLEMELMGERLLFSVKNAESPHHVNTVSMSGEMRQLFGTWRPVVSLIQLGMPVYAFLEEGWINVYRNPEDGDFLCLDNVEIDTDIVMSTDWDADSNPDLVMVGHDTHIPHRYCLSFWRSRMGDIFLSADLQGKRGEELIEEKEYEQALSHLFPSLVSFERLLGKKEAAMAIRQDIRRAKEAVVSREKRQKAAYALFSGFLVTFFTFVSFHGALLIRRRWQTRQEKEGILRESDYALIDDSVLHDGCKNIDAMKSSVSRLVERPSEEKQLSRFLSNFESWRRYYFTPQIESLLNKMDPCRYQAHNLFEQTGKLERQVNGILSRESRSTHEAYGEIKKILFDLDSEIRDRLRPAVKKGVLFDIDEILSFAVGMIRDNRQEERRRYSITIDYQNGLPDEQTWLPPNRVRRLYRILNNLMDNAFEAVLIALRRIGELPAERRQIKVSLNPIGESDVGIKIEDRGIGMDDTTKKRFFERGFSTKGWGRGYGLTEKDIEWIRRYGKFDVKSVVGSGTTICMELWREKGKEEKDEAEAGDLDH